jgi:hypothetical protein
VTFPRSALGNVAKNLRREMTEYLKMGYLLHSGNCSRSELAGRSPWIALEVLYRRHKRRQGPPHAKGGRLRPYRTSAWTNLADVLASRKSKYDDALF